MCFRFDSGSPVLQWLLCFSVRRHRLDSVDVRVASAKKASRDCFLIQRSETKNVVAYRRNRCRKKSVVDRRMCLAHVPAVMFKPMMQSFRKRFCQPSNQMLLPRGASLRFFPLILSMLLDCISFMVITGHCRPLMFRSTFCCVSF